MIVNSLRVQVIGRSSFNQWSGFKNIFKEQLHISTSSIRITNENVKLTSVV